MKYILLALVVVLAWSGASASNAKDDFTKQVQHLVREVKMPKAMMRNLIGLKWTLKTTLGTRWPDCEVNLIGSVAYGLAMTFSDMDCVIILPTHTDNTYDGMRQVIEEATLLLQQQNTFENFFTWTNLSVPVLSFEHAPTKTDIDVSFNNRNQRFRSLLLRNVLQDKRARYLAFIVKFWFSTTANQFLRNQGLMLMVILYLQQKSLLPSIASLQENAAPVMIDEWNYGFNKVNYESQNHDSMSSIVGGFFKYYASFNFEDYIISPYVGYPVAKSAFKFDEKVPDEYKLYKNNVKSQTTEPLAVTEGVLIQDMFVHNEAIANAQTVADFRDVFKDADAKFQKNPIAFLKYLHSGKSLAQHRIVSTVS